MPIDPLLSQSYGRIIDRHAASEAFGPVPFAERESSAVQSNDRWASAHSKPAPTVESERRNYVVRMFQFRERIADSEAINNLEATFARASQDQLRDLFGNQARINPPMSLPSFRPARSGPE